MITSRLFVYISNDNKVWRRSVKGPQRSRGTNRQTNAASIIVWFSVDILIYIYNIHIFVHKVSYIINVSHMIHTLSVSLVNS